MRQHLCTKPIRRRWSLDIPRLFFQRDVIRNFSFRVEINTYRNDLSVLAYNAEATCALCPVSKGGGVSYRTFELPISLQFILPLKKNTVDIGILVGINLEMNLKNGQSYEYSPSFGLHPGVFDVLKAIEDNSIKPFTCSYALGVQIKVWRISVIGRVAANISRTITSDISVWGQRYPFGTNQTSSMLTIAYHISPKK